MIKTIPENDQKEHSRFQLLDTIEIRGNNDIWPQLLSTPERDD